jgi:hypothetical protein
MYGEDSIRIDLRGSANEQAGGLYTIPRHKKVLMAADRAPYLRLRRDGVLSHGNAS